MKRTRNRFFSLSLILVIMITYVFPIQVFAEEVSGNVTAGMNAKGVLSHTNGSATSTVSISGTYYPLSASLTVKAALFYKYGWNLSPQYTLTSAANSGRTLSTTAKTDVSIKSIGSAGFFRAAAANGSWEDSIKLGETFGIDW